MDDNSYVNVEMLWDNLLSRDPATICQMFASLSSEEHARVLAHLQRMATEADWHPEQQISAEIALKAIQNFCQDNDG